MKILLNSSTSKTSRNENNTINVGLSGGRRTLPTTEFTTLFSELEQYNLERKNSNLVRLTCTINPICSNVLHNMVSEIIYKEGSDEAISMNFSVDDFMDKVKDDLISKTKSHFNSSFDAIEDTQISSIDGVTYHCGLDIFNNHILRSNTFRAVNFVKNGARKKEFNTISDYLRDYDGNTIKVNFEEQRTTTQKDARIYNYDNIDTFENCVKTKLHDQNGWIGFYNKAKLTVFNEDGIESKFNKVICSKKPCSFVDLAPERDLFYVTPKYNPYRKRLEKNWHYFLTYPSSSTTNVSFINEKLKTLKIVVFDDDTKNSNGFSSMVFYSASMHGLKMGDKVNIYANENVVFENAIVNEIVDPYVFMVGKSGISLSDGWKALSALTELGEYVEVSDNGLVVTISGISDYYVINDKVNLDPNMQDLSFAKVINGRKCDYYVRIFSKIPNWKFVDEAVTEYSMYKDGSDLITKYQGVENEFENHVSKLSFAKNVYSDDVGEIVFTDDIDLSYLKDNLNRDVHEIYLTVLKANDGYKEWYTSKDTTNENITYSHVFGKLSCGFELSKESLINDSFKTIRNVTNSRGFNVDGLDMSVIREKYTEDNSQDDYEVVRDFDKAFYGDLVCFSQFDFTEESIQMSCFRFNTTQRELNAPPFNQIRYNEIEADQDDTNGTNFNVVDKKFTSQISDRREGYVYESHYRIPIHTFSPELKTQMPKFYTIKRCLKQVDGGFIITTLEKMYLEENDKFTIYDRNTMKYYNGVCKKVIGGREIKCSIVGEEDEMFVYNAVHRYKMFKPYETIPTNAYLVRDGSCRYIWRELIRNGYDNNVGTDVEHYPFSNGRLYANANFNLFVRRQDPHDYVTFYSKHFTAFHPAIYPYDGESKEMLVEETNEYFDDELITC